MRGTAVLLVIIEEIAELISLISPTLLTTPSRAPTATTMIIVLHGSAFRASPSLATPHKTRIAEAKNAARPIFTLNPIISNNMSGIPSKDKIWSLVKEGNFVSVKFCFGAFNLYPLNTMNTTIP